MKKSQIVKKIISEKFASKAQQRLFYAMADKDTKKGKKFKKWAKEFSDDTDFDELPEKVSKKKKKRESVNPKMKKGDLMEYINSKKILNEQDREMFLITEIPRSDKVKIFRFFETLRDSGLINMFGSYPILNWTRDDLERWLYGLRKDIDSIESEIENLEYDNDEGDYDSEIESLQRDLEIINKLLDTKDEIRDILIRAALKRIDNTDGDHELRNVQRVFEKMAKECWKMWTTTLYG